MAVVSKQSFSLANAQAKRGPLVRVEISPGRFVKMYREDAVIAGHIPATKAQPAADNKMRAAEGDKATLHPHLRPLSEIALGPHPHAGPALGSLSAPPIRGAGEEREDEADFTVIAGVGQATARALKARGIRTFEQLRAAGQLNFISGATMQAIEKWRESGG